MYSTIFSWHLRTYYLIGHLPAAFMASYVGGDSQPSSLMLRVVFPTILLAIRWWNTSNTFIIASVINQLLLPYNSTVCATDLYIISLSITFAPIFSGTFNTMPHHLCALPRFWYRESQFLLLNAMVRPKGEMRPLNPGGPI